MKRLRHALLALVPLTLGIALALFCATGRVTVETSFERLAGGAMVPEAVLTASSSVVPLLVSSTDAHLARRAAEKLSRDLASLDGAGLRARIDGELEGILSFVATNRAGLAAADARADLATPEGRARIARRYAKRIYSDPTPPLFPPTIDPFGLAEGFVRSFKGGHAGWTLRDGFLSSETNGMTTILLALDLDRETTGSPDAISKFASRLEETLNHVRSPGVEVLPCGVPMHTARAASRCKAQIGVLSAVSLVFIALLAVFAFKSASWIPLLGASLLTSALAGALALAMLFGSVHAMTLVVGTTVLGLVIDYSFHWLLQKPERLAKTRRSLLVSFATTETSLLPLALSSIPVLRQCAVFLGGGLAAALAVVLLLYPVPECGGEKPLADTESANARTIPRLARIILAIAALAAAATGILHIRIATTPEALYRPPADLARAERLLAERSGTLGADRGTIVTTGGSLDHRLSLEESLGLDDATPHLSAFLPSLTTRQAVAEDVSRLYREQGVRQSELLGLSELVVPPEPKPWPEDGIPDALARPFTSGEALVVPSARRPDRRLPSDVAFWQPRERLASVLAEWTQETRDRLALSIALLLVLLAAIYRRAAAAILAPAVVSLVVTGATLGIAGQPVTLFHLLAAFMLVGIGLDYAVFLRDGDRSVLKPAFCSLASSLVGFGSLAFVDFPVAQAFGVTLAIGLPVAFLSAMALARPASSTSQTSQTFQTSPSEHAASPLGLETLLLVYRIFGLRVLHLLSAAVGATAWVCSPAIRRASPRLAKVVAFTRSLADKLVVMAGGRRLPCVATDGSPDSESFLADIRAGTGVFILSSHVGTIEVLAALGETQTNFHAWTDVGRTAVFNEFYLRHAKRPRVVIHPVSDIGIKSAFLAGDALERGDSLVMAGDRGRGAFRFARAMGAHVYFVACVAVGGMRYRAVIRRLPDGKGEMEAAYASVRDALAEEFPDQVFDWDQEEGKERT